jgi:hypothetical protein
MAKDPKDNAERYGLSPDVAADMEPEEGPPLGGQGGEDRTRLPERSKHTDHGPKTRARAKDIINRHP